MISANNTHSVRRPWWLTPAQRLVSLLPAGRFRASEWLGRRVRQPFVGTMDSEQGRLEFECDLRDSIAREVFFTGRYEPQETILLQRLLNAGQTFVDVGANWGYFSLLAAQVVGANGKVLSCEPDPRLYSLLQSNLQRNHLRQVHALQLAISNQHGTAQLQGFEEDQGNWGVSRIRVSTEPDDLPQNTFTAQTQPLDDVLDQLGIKTVDLVKLDIEGAEALALQGMRTGLREHRYRLLLVEFHPTLLPEFGTSAAELADQICEAGYTALVVDHSPQMNRQAAYSRNMAPSDFVAPAGNKFGWDKWPHLLFVSPQRTELLDSLCNANDV
ncbi:MAG: FkbM family methyltransferase [Pirellulaceae bacterium]